MNTYQEYTKHITLNHRQPEFVVGVGGKSHPLDLKRSYYKDEQTRDWSRTSQIADALLTLPSAPDLMTGIKNIVMATMGFVSHKDIFLLTCPIFAEQVSKDTKGVSVLVDDTIYKKLYAVSGIYLLVKAEKFATVMTFTLNPEQWTAEEMAMAETGIVDHFGVVVLPELGYRLTAV